MNGPFKFQVILNAGFFYILFFHSEMPLENVTFLRLQKTISNLLEFNIQRGCSFTLQKILSNGITLVIYKRSKILKPIRHFMTYLTGFLDLIDPSFLYIMGANHKQCHSITNKHQKANP
jgi:hypothetical protein